MSETRALISRASGGFPQHRLNDTSIEKKNVSSSIASPSVRAHVVLRLGSIVPTAGQSRCRLR
jgi:hypothetical protein